MCRLRLLLQALMAERAVQREPESAQQRQGPARAPVLGQGLERALVQARPAPAPAKWALAAIRPS